MTYQEVVMVAVGSKARAEEILFDRLGQYDFYDEPRAALATDLIDALDRAQFFADEATLAEIDRLAGEILTYKPYGGEHALPSSLALALATAVRKLGIGGTK